jgi:flagellar hook-basal body complex protein FliE
MSIEAIGAIGSPFGVVGPLSATGTSGTDAASGSNFAAQLGKGLESLQGMQDKADGLAVQAATGSLTDVHDYMIASTEAALATQLTVAVRNKAVEAFNEIMRMQA